MIIFNAKDYGIIPGGEIGKELAALLSDASCCVGEKTVVFEAGDYYIDSEKCEKHMLRITNTVGDEEFSKDETPHLNAVAFYIDHAAGLTVDGNGSLFIIDGKATNIAVENSENIAVKNLEIRHSHPDIHMLRVVKKTAFSVDFELDRDTQYDFKDGKLFFYGHNYRVRADKNARSAWWIGLVRKQTPDRIERVQHPFFAALKYADMGGRRIRVIYPNTSRFVLGDCYHIYDVRRQYTGIFVNNTKGITIENVKQRFNYSLAFVAQNSENITVDSVDFSPEENCPRKMASLADFFQICMCRGNVMVQNGNFDSAGDDCLNIHGIHFGITEVKKNNLKVRFMHPQTHGFNPLRAGDEIAFINPATLLEQGRTVIESSELINEYEIKLSVTDSCAAAAGMAIEDISACPELLFRNNRVAHIITRGILITNRNKVVIENNHFIANTMSGILIADDARNWYESGMCCDVTIKDNVFEWCGETPVLINPENTKHLGAVHRNVSITGNSFISYKGCCVRAKSTDGILFENNIVSGDDIIKTQNCTNVVIR